MAISFRHLTALLVILPFIAGISVAHAQPAAPKPSDFCLLGMTNLGELHYDQAGRAMSVYVGHNNFSAPAEVPPSGKLELYRYEPASDPAEPPRRVPVISVRLPATENTRFLVVLYPEGKPPMQSKPDNRPLRALILDHSLNAFPAQNIRVYSFSSRPIVIKFGKDAVPIPPNKEVLIPYPTDPRSWLQVATVGEQGWQRVIGTPQMLAPDTRLSVFFSDVPPTELTPNPVSLSMRKLLEPVPVK